MLRLPLPARHVLVALLVSLGSACDGGITEPAELPEDLVGGYHLVSVDGNPLPGDVGFALGIPRRTEIVEGFVQITEDARFVDLTLFRLYHQDGVNYDQLTAADQGNVRMFDDTTVEFLPLGAPAYRMHFDRSRDIPALVQDWNGFELRYELAPSQPGG